MNTILKGSNSNWVHLFLSVKPHKEVATIHPSPHTQEVQELLHRSYTNIQTDKRVGVLLRRLTYSTVADEIILGSHINSCLDYVAIFAVPDHHLHT